MFSLDSSSRGSLSFSFCNCVDSRFSPSINSLEATWYTGNECTGKGFPLLLWGIQSLQQHKNIIITCRCATCQEEKVRSPDRAEHRWFKFKPAPNKINGRLSAFRSHWAKPNWRLQAKQTYYFFLKIIRKRRSKQVNIPSWQKQSQTWVFSDWQY